MANKIYITGSRACFLVALFSFIALTGCKQDPLAQLPAFDILLADSTTVLNTGDLPEGNVSIFIHFDSDCKGCQEETTSLLQQMDKLKDVKIYFLTVQHFERLRVFRDHFKLANYPNIVVGQDPELFFPRHFHSGVTPLLALYDKRHYLRAVYEGKADMEDLMTRIKEIQ